MKEIQKFNRNTLNLLSINGIPFKGGGRQQVVFFINSMGGQSNTIPVNRLSDWLQHHNTEGMGFSASRDFVLKKSAGKQPKRRKK